MWNWGTKALIAASSQEGDTTGANSSRPVTKEWAPITSMHSKSTCCCLVLLISFLTFTMERIGADIHSAFPSPPSIKSTFKVDFQGNVSIFESGVSGLGWRFQVELSSLSISYRKIRIFFVPGLLDMRAAGDVCIHMKFFPLIGDARVQGPDKTTLSLPSPHLIDASQASYYEIGTWYVHPKSPTTFSFSVSLPKTTMPRLQAPHSLVDPSFTAPKLQKTLQKALLGTTDFSDVQFILFSRRVDGHRVGGQRVLHGNSELLVGHNDYVDERAFIIPSIANSYADRFPTVLRGNPKEGVNSDAKRLLNGATETAEIYGYDSDSDLESEWDNDESDLVQPMDRVDLDTSSLSSLSSEGEEDKPPSTGGEKEKEVIVEPKFRDNTSRRVIKISDTSART